MGAGRHASLVREESGSELVEFSFSAILLLTVIFGIAGCALALYAYHYCAQMAREATRYAAVRGATWTGIPCATTATYSCAATASNVASYVVSITPNGFSAANLSVVTTWPGTTATGAICSATHVNNSPGCIVSVQVSYAFSYAMPFLPQTPLNLSSTSRVTITE